ncbi:MAG TPA: hypothetical protein DDW65_06080 [Firmicutes bacterium]|jgi:hypothetical protein|nr:hypothetical protein [Bacillota bacterium]
MLSSLKGWLKIYLFYGLIFFLLGLFGSLASDQVKLANWSALQFQNLKRVWTFLTVGENDEPAIPAFTSSSGRFILQVYRDQEPNRQFDTMLQKLQIKLQSRFPQIISIPVVNLNTPVPELDSGKVPGILIGFKQSSDLPKADKADLVIHNSLYWGIPDQTSSVRAGKLFQMISGKLCDFDFTKQTWRHGAVYELDWVSSGSQNQNADILTAFMTFITEEVIQRISNQNLN